MVTSYTHELAEDLPPRADCCQGLVMSKDLPTRFLIDETGEAIYKYAYYVRLKTDVSRKVPVPWGRQPPVPDDNAPAGEKADYALYLMILFRAHRRIEDLVLAIWGGATLFVSEEAAQLAVYNVFLQWRRTLDNKAAEALLQARVAFPEGSQ